MSADTKGTTVRAEVKQSDREVHGGMDGAMAGAARRCARCRREERVRQEDGGRDRRSERDEKGGEGGSSCWWSGWARVRTDN